MTQHNRYRLYWPLAFLLPALLLTLAYAAKGFAPFGDKSILTYDMSSQYVEFFCALKNGDLFFSWSKALGSSYIGVFSYYVSSPLSLLTLLVPNEAMPVGLLWLTVLKFGLAGLACFLFLSRQFPGRGFTALLGAVCYAMCAYNVAYSLCIMWLDGVIWLPVVLLGVERVLDGRGRWLLSLSLAACFLSTWYISYMVGGFCLLWLVARAVARGMGLREGLLRLRDLIGCALWALGVTAWLWLPTLLSMFGGKFSVPLTDYDGLVNFHPLELLGQFLPGQVQPYYGSLPLLYCGTLTALAALGSFFLRAIPARARAAYGALVLVLALSLWLSPLDRVWHLFQYPNSFPYRYSFLMSFLLVFLACHTLNQAQDALAAPGCRAARGWAALLLAATVCGEMGYNAAATFRGLEQTHRYESYDSYQDYYGANAALADRAQALAGAGRFYRMGATQDRGLNAPLSFGYPGVTHYSSFFNSRLNTLLHSLGFAQSWYWTAYYGSTPLTDALLSIRYVLSANPMPSGYTALDARWELTLYENPTVLPLAFSAPEGLLELELDNQDPFQNQNRLFAALTGWEEPLYTPVAPDALVEEADGTVTLTFQGSGLPLYANLSSVGMTDLWVDGAYRTALNTDETRCVHYLGSPAQGEALTAVLRCTSLQDWSGRFYALNPDALTQGLSALADGPEPQVEGGTVYLSVTAQAGQAIVTTIPDEPGWHAYVDGQEVPLCSFLDAFLALEVGPGNHTILLRYTPPGLLPGLALTGGALLLAAALILIRLRRRARP